MQAAQHAGRDDLGAVHQLKQRRDGQELPR
jgi:hypothetical protein